MNHSFKRVFPYLIIFLLTAAVYFQNLWFDYSYLDDNLIVFQEYHKINSVSNIPSTFTGGYLYDNYYRPMVMISFIVDTAIAGQSSSMYHLTNLILHLLICFLAYLLLKKLTGEDFLSLILALFFSIHPVNINAVSWIAGRNDLLLTLFTLLSFLFFIKYSRENKNSFLLLSALFYLLGMFSKETAVLIPLLLLFYFLLVNEFKIRSAIEKILLIILVYTIPALIYLVLRFVLSPVKSTGEISLSAFFQNLNIPFEYVAKMFYLFGISQLSMTNSTLIVLGILISAVILLLVIFNKNIDKKLILLGFIFFIVFVLPPLFVRMPASDGEFNYIDCRFYLPVFGILLIFAAIIRSYKSLAFWKKKSSKTVLTVLVSVFFVYVLVFNLTENQYYRNGKVFWSNVLNIYPERATYWMGLGYYYFDQKDYLKAAACAERAISLKPEITEYYQKASLAYDKAGNLRKSNALLEKLLVLDKDNARNYLLLIRNNLRLGDYDRATLIKTDLEKLPVYDLKKKSEIYSSAASLFIYSHKYDTAIELLHRAVDSQPGNPSHMNDLGVCFYYTGKIDSAKKYFSHAVKLDPSNKEFQKNYRLVNR